MKSKRSWTPLALLFFACCGGSGEGPPDAQAPIASLVAITVSPDPATIVVDGTRTDQAFTAEGTFEDGTHRDISQEVGWTIDDFQMGTIDTSSGVFTTFDHGGRVNITASARGLTGSAALQVVLTRRDVVTDGVGGDGATGPAAPANAPDLFGGAVSPEPARSPQIVYPYDKVLVPPNLGKMEFHYQPGAGNSIYELAFASATLDLKLYVRCGTPIDGGCLYQPTPQIWTWLARSNAGLGPVTVTVRATDDAGTDVAVSATHTIEFAKDDIKGAIYYWATTRRAILRWDFGNLDQHEPEIFFGASDTTTNECVGCHAVSRDGSRIAVQRHGGDFGEMYALNVADRTSLTGPTTTGPDGLPLIPLIAQPAVFASWSPDATQLVTVYDDGGEADGVDGGGFQGDGDDDNLVLVDPTTGLATSAIQVGGTDLHPVDHPDWSPDGTRIAFVSVGDDTRSLQRFNTGKVGFVENTGGVWGAPTFLTETTEGKNRYYPAFGPDSNLLAYDESTCPLDEPLSGQCNADSDATATLRFTHASLVPGAPPETPIAATNVNTPGVTDGATTALATSFPKWCPFEFERRVGSTEKLNWMTFSTTRRYGLREAPAVDPTVAEEATSGTLIWMTGIDPDKAAAGLDPTTPPFVLPFQDLTSSNHIAQWTTDAPPVIE